MNRQKLFALCIALLCTSLIPACGGGGGQPQSGFKTMGRRWVSVLGGGVSLRQPHQHSGPMDTRQRKPGRQRHLLRVASLRRPVPGRQREGSGALEHRRGNTGRWVECIGYLTPNIRDVTANSTQYSECLIAGVVFPMWMAPESIDLQAPPATFEIMSGKKRLDTTYGMPYIEYIDEYTGRVIGSTTATSMGLDGSSLQANMPNLSLVRSGVYHVLVSNIRADGSHEYVGTTTVECYGRDGTYEDPPDPGPCGCPPNHMACLPCGPQM